MAEATRVTTVTSAGDELQFGARAAIRILAQ